MSKRVKATLLNDMPIYEIGSKGKSKAKATVPKDVVPSCEACGMYLTCRSPKMEGYGRMDKGVMLIAEAPGGDEDNANIPLVGKSGKMIDKVVSGLGWDLDLDFYRTNVIQCRPPKNDLGSPKVRQLRIASCRSRWLNEIKMYKPKVVILLGNTPMEAVLGKTGIRRYRGFMIPSKECNAIMCPTYHPAYFLHGNDDALDVWLRDIDKFLTEGPKKAERLPELLDWKEDYEMYNLTTIDTALAVLNDLNLEEILAVDYETNGLFPYKMKWPQILCVSFTTKDLRSYCLPLRKGEYWDREQLEVIEDRLSKLLSNENVKKVIQNVQFEAMWTETLGVRLKGVVADTMIDAHLLNSRSGRGESRENRREGVTALGFQVFTEYGFEYKDMVNHAKLIDEPDDKLFKYNNLDTKFDMRLYLDREKSGVMEGMEFARKLFLDGQFMFQKWQAEGICIDVDELDRQDSEIIDEVEKIKDRILSSDPAQEFEVMNDRPLALGDNATTGDVKKLLFDVMKVPVIKTTDKGHASLTADVLMEYAKEYDICADMVRMRQLNHHRATYLTGVRSKVHNGKVNPSANLHLVTTYRSSYDSPNLQNIPKRSDAFKEVRRIVLPDPGHIIGEVDYSGIEVRVAAMVSKDPVLVKYLIEGGDMHADWTCKLFKLKKSVPKLRSLTKNMFVFPEFYGSWWKSIHYDLSQIPDFKKLFLGRNGYDVNAGEKHVEACEREFWNTFRVFKVWRDGQIKFYERNGYVQTLFGFRRYAPLNRNMIINSPIQGHAFHLLLYAIEQIENDPEWEKFESRLMFEVHDALVISVHPDEKEAVREFVTDKMCNLPFDFVNVPVSVEWEFSTLDKPSWLDVK